jgi:hypothetical protein
MAMGDAARSGARVPVLTLVVPGCRGRRALAPTSDLAGNIGRAVLVGRMSGRRLRMLLRRTLNEPW